VPFEKGCQALRGLRLNGLRCAGGCPWGRALRGAPPWAPGVCPEGRQLLQGLHQVLWARGSGAIGTCRWRGEGHTKAGAQMSSYR